MRKWHHLDDKIPILQKLRYEITMSAMAVCGDHSTRLRPEVTDWLYEMVGDTVGPNKNWSYVEERDGKVLFFFEEETRAIQFKLRWA